MKKAICFDWVQAHVKLSIPEGTEPIYYVPVANTKFYCEDTGKRNLHFKKVFSIGLPVDGENIELATLETCPHVSFIPEDSAILKLANRVLYSENYKKILVEILEAFNFKFHNYTRLDVAIDIHNFLHSSVQHVIQSISDNTLVIRGNKGERVFCEEEHKEYLNRNSELQFYKKKKVFTGLKLGSRNSQVMVNLYNKTIELVKKKDKPWIREFWRKNNFYEGLPVWRLEFSIKKSTKSIVDIETGEVINFSDIDLIDRLRSIAQTMVDEHFALGISRANVQFCRLERFYIFDRIDFPVLLKRVSKKLQATTMVKYRIKKLIDSAKIYKCMKKLNRRAFELVNHAVDVVRQHDLGEWFAKNYGNVAKYYA